jgi:hypothetical protein
MATSTAAATRRQPSVALSAAALALLAPLAAALWWYGLAHLAALLGYPYPHDGLEGTLLHEARLLRGGAPLYGSLERHAFVSAPYPPLHPLLLALFDLHPGPHVFWSGRVISLLALATTTSLGALLIRRCSGSWAAALIGAGLFVSAPPVLLWSTRVKPDLMALAFTTAGLLLTARALGGGPRARGGGGPTALLGAICFACAFFTKQTDVAGPLAAALALAAGDLRDWRAARLQRSAKPVGSATFVRGLPLRWRTLTFVLVYLSLALGGWLLLDRFTDGGYTLHVWWNFRRGSWYSLGLLGKIVGLLWFWWPMMLLSGACALLAIRRRELMVPASYALIAPLTLLYAGETGANHNHLLETHLALALAGGCTLGCAARALARGARLAALPVALAGLQLLLAFSPPDWYAGQLQPRETPARFLNLMRQTPGEILADDTGLLLQAGKPLRYDDPSTIGPAARSGLWDQSGLIEDIERRRFSAIMIPVNAEESLEDPSGRWTAEVLAAIRRHYRLAFRDQIYTFVPR